VSRTTSECLIIKISSHYGRIGMALWALLAMHINIAYAQSLDAHALEPKSPAIGGVPPSINHLYTDVDMRVRLATKPNESPCSGDQIGRAHV
jgi:hypothetical protein